jgi:hypothetical protein
VTAHPLSQGELFCLHYMMDIENHVPLYLSHLLVTRACMDPILTAFLACWNYEELWHGEILGKLLNLYGIEFGTQDRIANVRARPGDRLRAGQQWKQGRAGQPVAQRLFADGHHQGGGAGRLEGPKRTAADVRKPGLDRATKATPPPEALSQLRRPRSVAVATAKRPVSTAPSKNP